MPKILKSHTAQTDLRLCKYLTQENILKIKIWTVQSKDTGNIQQKCIDTNWDLAKNAENGIDGHNNSRAR